jgi:hypothetical protein
MELETFAKAKSPVGMEASGACGTCTCAHLHFTHGALLRAQPFVEACVDRNATDQAVKYIARIEDPIPRMEWFCRIGCGGKHAHAPNLCRAHVTVPPSRQFKQAADVAVKERNREALRMVASQCRDPAQQAYVEDALKRANF